MGSRPGSINPYKLGIELFKDVEDRWNKGKFGKNGINGRSRRKSWDKHLGMGRQKI
jgi:stage V sporulation protein R